MKNHKRQIPAELLNPNEPWRQEHDEILSKISKPANFLNPSLLDDYYLIRFDDSVVEAPPHAFRLDGIVKPNGVKLNSRENIVDLITVKLFLIYSTDPAIGWTTSRSVLVIALGSLMTMIRWRNYVGIDRMSGITHAWFEDFVERLSEGASSQTLIPLKERFDDLAADMLSGRREVPIYWTGSHYALAMSVISAEIGVNKFLGAPTDTVIQLESLALRRLEEEQAAQFPDCTRKVNFYKRFEREAAKEVARLQGPIVDADEEKSLASISIEAILLPFDKLQLYQKFMGHDPLGCQPFGPALSRRGLAATIGKYPGRTPSPPAYQTCFLIDRALRWLISYSPYLLALLREIRLSSDGQGGALSADYRQSFLTKLLSEMPQPSNMAAISGLPAKLIPRFSRFEEDGKNFGSDAVDLRTAIFVYLAAACFIVIATFSARRREELLSLRDDCIDEDDDGDWLNTWIEKTIRDLDRIPCPRSVRLAVDILKELSIEKRTADGSRRLFNFMNPLSRNSLIWFDPEEAVNAFAKFVGVPPSDDDSIWHWAPHQFRKFFPVLYMFWFRFPNLTALSDYLKHFNIDVTRRYASNPVRGELLQLSESRDASEAQRKAAKRVISHQAIRARDLEETRRDFLRELVCNVAIGDEVVGGFGGQALKEEIFAIIGNVDRGSLRVALSPFVSAVKRGITISPSADILGSITESIIKFADGEVFDRHPDGSGFCRCGSKPLQLNTAECLKRRERETGLPSSTAGGRDLRYATDDACSGCVQNAQLRDNEQYWVVEEAKAGDVAKHGATPHLREVYAKRQGMCQRHLDRWHPEARKAGETDAAAASTSMGRCPCPHP